MSVAVFQLRHVLRRLVLTALLAAASVALAAFDIVPKDQGIGGTGQISRGDDNGISGTGYIGTITDFGSIIINGREIEIDDKTVVNIDGVAASISDLKKGHVIAARSANINAVETATKVDVYHAVVGKLETYDPATGIGAILGQIVDFNSRLDRQKLFVGRWIAISGLRSSNHVVIASRVEPSAPHRFLVRGKKQQIQAALSDLKISNRKISQSGELVLSGEISTGKAKIRKLEPYSAMSIFNGVNEVIIESYLSHTLASGQRVEIDAFHQTLVIPKALNANDLQLRDRVVFSALKSGKQFVVLQAELAPFMDQASASSKGLTKSTVDTLSRDSLTDQQTDGQGSGIEDESQNSDTTNTNSGTGAAGSSSEDQNSGSDDGVEGNDGSQPNGANGGEQNSNDAPSPEGGDHGAGAESDANGTGGEKDN